MDEELENLVEVHPLSGEVTRALEGILYPAERAALVHVARENAAPRMLLSLISALPDRRFLAQAEVVRALEEQVLPLSGGA